MTSLPFSGLAPIALTEQSLVDVCDLLQADRFEVTDLRVSFVRRESDGRQQRWAGWLGDHVVAGRDGWRITSELGPETTWASVA